MTILLFLYIIQNSIAGGGSLWLFYILHEIINYKCINHCEIFVLYENIEEELEIQDLILFQVPDEHLH